jgi:hypothetical protein
MNFKSSKANGGGYNTGKQKNFKKIECGKKLGKTKSKKEVVKSQMNT